MRNSFRNIFLVFGFCSLASAAQAESLTLTFDKSLQMTQLVASATPAAGAQSAAQIITLYPNAYSSRTGQTENIYDYDKKTFTVVNHAAKTYTLYPLHSVALFRSRDRTSRLGMKITMYQQKTGSATPPISVLTEDIDIDMMLAANTNNKTAEKIKIKKEAGKIVFSDDKSAVIATAETGVPDSLPQALRKTYAHFIVYEFTMHPAIKKTLGAETGALKKLTFTNRDMFRNLAAVYTWSQKSSQQGTENAPVIPENYKRIYHLDPELDAAFKASLTPYVFDSEGLQKEVSDLVDKRQYLLAFLKAQAVMLSMTPAEIKQHQEAFNTANKAAQNFRKAAYLAVVQTPDDAAELKQYTDVLEAAKSEAGDMTWVIDYFIDKHTRAILATKTNPSKSDLEQLAALQARYLMTLKRVPHNIAVYQATGDTHYSRLEVPTAMLYWSHVAALTPQSQTAHKLEQMKADAEKDFPEYF